MATRTNKNWSRKETLLAFNLFCKISFGKIDGGNREVIRLARQLGRSADAVAMKMFNLASFDPSLRERKISGLRHASKMDKLIWEEFHESPEKILIESQKLADEINDEQRYPGSYQETEKRPLQIAEESREAMTEIRVGQKAFRDAVLAAYEGKCCITGISEPKVLIASHIIPWHKGVHRLDPHNGLCLNALHDKAYDYGLISVTPDFHIAVSKRLHKAAEKSEKIRFITESEGQEIMQPEKFSPDPRFLKYHYQNVFLDSL